MPWNIREDQIDVAAALSRYVRLTHDDDAFAHLNSRVVDEAWAAECERRGGAGKAQANGFVTYEAFVQATSTLVRYAITQGWLLSVEAGIVGLDRLSFLTAPEPTDELVLGNTDAVMVHDLDGTPIGIVNVYVVGATGLGQKAP